VLASLPLDGDAPRLIAEAQCGRTIAPSDPEAMAQAILELFQAPELREQMGVRGRRYAVQHLSLERAAELIENHISRIQSTY
jgi:glycosyltransferase involved in cell wall biosynthesis